MAQERTLPMLLLNLGGEMVYILEQRLQAQRVPPEKADRVLVDICRLLLHDRFLAELLVPQPLGHVAALRTFFRDLAHSSIMRLDDESMAKMWDLMTMAVKLQALRADSPGELLQATLNHIDYIGDHVPAVRAQADHASQGLYRFYSRMSSGELQAVRYCVLNYLQGLAVRVSLFLTHGLQDMHGKLVVPKDGPVPPGCEVPGTIRVMDGGGREVDSVVQVIPFPPGGQFTSPARDAGRGGNTELGFNLYSELEDPGAGGPGGGPGAAGAGRRGRRRSSLAGAATAAAAGVVDGQGRPLYVGREELNMLMAQLLGNRPSPRDRDVPTRLLCVSLFNSGPMLSIDASGSAGSRSASLRQVLSDLDVGGVAAPDGLPGHAGNPGPSSAGTLLEFWDDLDEEDADEAEAEAAEQQPLLSGAATAQPGR
ncbi:hypothetical protein ONE63_002726 [Megalurothrips usitatus]|uniref:Protein OSCP1 n=1 Tax=Megalurothrips usitatus TaxID=439358 RepID=A0AAV7X847_9NEOP|nr:hypothetical protein ONE63_002726 [Megalurothrips usitatus]